MKIKMTLASKKDKKPTISSNELKCNWTNILIKMMLDGEVFYSTWHLSRNSKTYYANSWDKKLPSVGKPLFCEILMIETRL